MGDEHRRELERAAVPVVVIGGPEAETRVDTVRADSRKGAAEAVRHLHDVGRRRIAFVNGPPNTVPGRSRHAGYLDGLADCGLERDETLVEVADDFMVEPGRAACERLLARARPDAIFCANDLLAVGALAALRAANLDVPGDVAVVGMDNTPLAEHTWPPLTTVDLGSAERARLAADLLLKRIDQPAPAPAERQRRAAARRPRLHGRAAVSTMTDAQRYPAPRRGRSRAGVDLSGPEALLLLIPALLPIVLLSVRAARARDLPRLHELARRPRRLHALHRDRQLPAADPRRPVRQLVQDRADLGGLA